MAQRQQAAPALPPEIWQLIAAHLDLREWAQASGTCRTTWQLQLDQINLTELVNPAGAAWVLKRAHRARTMALGELNSGPKENAAAAALMHADNSWANLRALFVGSISEFPDACKPSFLSAMTWVLGRATQLSFLSLRLDELQCLPNLAHLRHLQLTVLDGFKDLAPSLVYLVNLCTLHLQQAPEFNVEKRADINLAGLNQLQSVMLCCVLPASLSLPEGAALHVRFRDPRAAQDGVWTSVAPFMQSVQIMSEDDSDGNIRDVSQVPSFLLGPSGLKSIVLDILSFGTEGAPILLSGSFLQVERLVLQCHAELCVRIPAGDVPWLVTKFSSYNLLDIMFGDVEDFLDCCPAFSIGFKKLQGLNLTQLCQCMSERGIQWAPGPHHGDLQSWYQECNTIHTPDLYCSRLDWCDDVCDPECGTCAICCNKGACGPDAQMLGRLECLF